MGDDCCCCVRAWPPPFRFLGSFLRGFAALVGETAILSRGPAYIWRGGSTHHRRGFRPGGNKPPGFLARLAVQLACIYCPPPSGVVSLARGAAPCVPETENGRACGVAFVFSYVICMSCIAICQQISVGCGVGLVSRQCFRTNFPAAVERESKLQE